MKYDQFIFFPNPTELLFLHPDINESHLPFQGETCIHIVNLFLMNN